MAEDRGKKIANSEVAKVVKDAQVAAKETSRRKCQNTRNGGHLQSKLSPLTQHHVEFLIGSVTTRWALI